MSKPVKSTHQPTHKPAHDVEHTLASLTEKALQEFGGNRTHAAVSLGISVRTMRNWIRRFNLSDKFPAKTN